MELTDIRRQRDAWQQDATKELATGKTANAIHRYDQHSHVHDFETKAAAKIALTEVWSDARLSDPTKTQIMLAYNRDDVLELNKIARSLRENQGELGKNMVFQTERGERVFAEHDRVYFLKNDKSLGVMNGTLGTIEATKDGAITIRLDRDERTKTDRCVTVTMDRYNQLDYGYAATIHKAQGVTVDRSYVLASQYLDAHSTYVGMSRHRESADLFYGRDTFLTKDDLVRTLGRERSKDVTLDYMQNRQQDHDSARERFKSEPLRAQNAIERVQIRREAKAFQMAVECLEQQYGKSVSQQLENGEKGIYREIVEIGKHRFSVIEQENGVKLVPYEKGAEFHRGQAVKIKAEHIGSDKEHITLDNDQGKNIAKDHSRARERDL